MANDSSRRLWWLILPAVLFAVGCSTSTFTPPQLPPETATRPAPSDLEVIRSPRDLGEDYVYPENLTTQTIAWFRDEIDWHLHLASKRYAYAGITFRRPYDFSQVKSKTVLSFRMKPAELAPYISIGLVDGDRLPDHVMLDVPLGKVVRNDATGWVSIRIPLDDFGSEGIPITGPGELPPAAGRVPFDWTDVREIRFSTYGRIPREEILVTEMHFRR